MMHLKHFLKCIIYTCHFSLYLLNSLSLSCLLLRQVQVKKTRLLLGLLLSQVPGKSDSLLGTGIAHILPQIDFSVRA